MKIHMNDQLDGSFGGEEMNFTLLVSMEWYITGKECTPCIITHRITAHITPFFLYQHLS